MTVDQRKLWGCLKGVGIGGRALAFLKGAYSDVSCEIKVGEYSVEVNDEKCGVMHMRRKGVKRTEDMFYVGKEEIAIVEEYESLGCVVDEHGQCRRMVEERAN